MPPLDPRDASSSDADPVPPFEVNTPYAPTPDNRPAALEHSPLPLTLEAHSQMSFGERAALEGMLAQIRPQLAIEIGTAEGGSLARIASYSTEVHAIDVSFEELKCSIPDHVTFHGGGSAAVLPQLLEEFASSDRTLDFALVDGDHSFAGVAGDLRALLHSPCTARSVIVVHDTMNEEVRAGIESVELDGFDKVVYYELDFVPGYIYREGNARHAVWGGLGVIICDAARSEAYSGSPRQWRYYEPYAAVHRMRAELLGAADHTDTTEHGGKAAHADQDGELLADVEQLRARVSASEAELARERHALQVVYSSRSWRLTAPLRGMAQRLRKRFSGRR